MWASAPPRLGALAAIAYASGCFFITDFDNLSGAGGGGDGSGASAGMSTSSGGGNPGGMGGAGGSASGGAGSGPGGGGTGGVGASGAGGAGGVGGGGTGGVGGSPPQLPAVVINELVCDPLPGDEDWIEFYNNEAVSADISGWFFTDGSNSFFFPNNTVLAAGGYLTLDRNAPGSFTFGFSKDGETVYLFTDMAVSVDSTSWSAGQAQQPMSWGRLPNGTGAFQSLSTTKNGPNN